MIRYTHQAEFRVLENLGEGILQDLHSSPLGTFIP